MYKMNQACAMFPQCSYSLSSPPSPPPPSRKDNNNKENVWVIIRETKLEIKSAPCFGHNPLSVSKLICLTNISSFQSCFLLLFVFFFLRVFLCVLLLLLLLYIS